MSIALEQRTITILCILSGWNRHFRTVCPANAHLYILIDCLFGEAKQAVINRGLIREGLLTERSNAKYRKLNDALFKCWNDYQEGGNMTPDQLLRRCAQVYTKHALVAV